MWHVFIHQSRNRTPVLFDRPKFPSFHPSEVAAYASIVSKRQLKSQKWSFHACTLSIA
jgi:hypothetical protein